MKKIFSLITLTTMLSACSSVDSLKPFDAEQARIWIESSFVSKPAQQRIAIDLPQHQIWKKVTATQDVFGATIKLIPSDASVTNWQESIQTNILGYLKNPHITAKAFAENNLQQIHAHCQQVTSDWLSENRQYVIYHVKMSHCDNIPAQRQFVKAFNGSDGVYVVRYVAVLGNVSEVQVNKMARVVGEAEFQNNPGY